MRVLITGAAGFLGREVSMSLDKKHEGYALFRSQELPIRNLWPLKGNILQPIDLEKELMKPIDAVVHLAALNRASSDLQSSRLFETNVMGTFNMLELARKKLTRKFIFASSAAVYGDKALQPIKETFSTDPGSLYGLSKLIGEQMCMHYRSNYEFSVICLRIANMYGPCQPSGFIVPDLFEKSKFSDAVVIENSSVTRDFVYVEDVAKAVERCLDVDISGVFNIGSGEETSALSIATELAKFSGKKVVIAKNANAKVRRNVLDISRARDFLCWEPKMPLEKGLKVTWQHLTERSGASG